MIIFQNISKDFPDGNSALSDVSFQIKDGEFVFFVGPSGAGKTTIMKLLRREILPSSGSILIKEKDLTEIEDDQVPVLRRQVAVCFQDFKLLNDRTAFENIAMSLEIMDIPEEEIMEKVTKALKSVGLEKKGSFFPAQLSGGELQRTGIARAIVADPDVLIADEPTGNLDPKSAFSILKLFKEINLSGTTVLVATHNAEVVDQFKERVIRLKSGKIVSDLQKSKYETKSQEK